VCLCKMIMLLTSISCGAVKTTSAKWTQTKSTVIVKFPLRRGSTKCTDESARLEGDTPQLFFSTVCGADTYQLNVALAGGVTGEPALKPDSRRSEVVVTLTKAKAREAWKHLTAEPERYKALITRAPAPYESDEPLRPSSSSSGGGGGGGGTQSVGVGAHGETAPQSDTQRKMLLDVARARTEKGKVDGATLDKMRAAIKQDPEDLEMHWALATALRGTSSYVDVKPKVRKELIKVLSRVVTLPPPPVDAGKTIAAAYHELGMLIATGKDDDRWMTAYEALYMAVQLEPSNREYQKVKKDVQDLALQEKHKKELSRAEDSEKAAKDAQAALEAEEDAEFERELADDDWKE